MKIILFLYVCSVAAIPLSPEMLRSIGDQIWMNECKKSIAGLTSWNAGEDFASMGIGHFIWCPQNGCGNFVGIFPKFLIFLKKKNKKIPQFIEDNPAGYVCPWPTREEFLSDLESSRMKELRSFLVDTIQEQVQFIGERVRSALPAMLDKAPLIKHTHIKKQYHRLSGTPQGMYVLLDYVNFKGESTAAKEHYNGAGWGLLDVLLRMKGSDKKTAPKEFSECAYALLEQRVKNAPAHRNEERWLPGWKKRLETYTTFHPSFSRSSRDRA